MTSRGSRRGGEGDGLVKKVERGSSGEEGERWRGRREGMVNAVVVGGVRVEVREIAMIVRWRRELRKPMMSACERGESGC